MSVNGNFFRNHDRTNTQTLLGNNGNQLDSTLRSSYLSGTKRKNAKYDLFYTYKDDKNYLLSTTIDDF
ncbi:hypothetical protein [Mucilaginibacter lacusdianchii]|uniref:hypothetical protein n=1 Tax=Mucilaginibacter lacusdianchii TaxID=2684211 RepID=UPI00131E4A7C|nr:hypothetical protein [Mucilaginibacter sp. JXJ CY 39]